MLADMLLFGYRCAGLRGERKYRNYLESVVSLPLGIAFIIVCPVVMETCVDQRRVSRCKVGHLLYRHFSSSLFLKHFPDDVTNELGTPCSDVVNCV